MFKVSKQIAYASLFSAALMASTALAEAGGPDKAPATQAPQPAQSQPAASGSQNIVTDQSKDEWRAGKLIGVPVYGPDNKKIGTISDIMIGHDGAAREAIIGVGGFLGIGQKNVGVPFHELQWRTEPRTVASTAPPTTSGGTSGTSGAGGTAQTTTPPKQTVDPAATEANQGHPDKAMLNMTVAQLKAAPDFKWAPDPYAQAESASHPQSQTTKP